MKVCPNCGHSSEKDNFCPYCGNPMMEQFPSEGEKKEGVSICPKCGKPLISGAEYCPYCAKDLSRDEFDTFFDEKTKSSGEGLEGVFPSSGVSSDPGYKICPKCGARYNALLAGCPDCARIVPEYAKKPADKYSSDAKSLGVSSVILAVIFPYLGFLLGIAGLIKYKKYPGSKKYFVLAIVIAVCWLAIVLSIVFSGAV